MTLFMCIDAKGDFSVANLETTEWAMTSPSRDIQLPLAANTFPPSKPPHMVKTQASNKS